MNNPNESKGKKERVQQPARVKCQAVLSVWTGRRRPSEVCRELAIPGNLLLGWQERALEGMLRALEPKTRRQEDRGPALDPRMERLLERKAARLEQRLLRVRTKAAPEKAAAK